MPRQSFHITGAFLALIINFFCISLSIMDKTPPVEKLVQKGKSQRPNMMSD